MEDSLSFHSFTLGLVNAMGSRMVLNLRKQGAAESSDSPPINIHFVNPQESYHPRDVDSKLLAKLEPRVHQPYGDLASGRDASDSDSIGGSSWVVNGAPRKPLKTKKPDPYFHNRRIAKLRNLKVKRAGTSHSAQSGSTPRPRHNLSGIFCDAPKPGSQAGPSSDAGSIYSGVALTTEDGDWFDMEMLPLPPGASSSAPKESGSAISSSRFAASDSDRRSGTSMV